MNRKMFLFQLMATLPITSIAMNLKDLNKLSESFEYTTKMPVLFLGHGSPMNAIEENDFVKGFRSIASNIQKPKAILCVSAHWETRGTQVTAMQQPKTIHDFGGFPKELFNVEYPAPGNPTLAKKTQNLIKSTPVILDDKWGLDHGAWSVIKHLYPNADVPVIQLSLDRTKTPAEHYAIAQELSKLREKGVLIVGSGNIVHNLSKIAWNKVNDDYAFDWALEVKYKVNQFIKDENHKALIDYTKLGQEFRLAIPTPEHYLPLLYSLALQDKGEKTKIFNDQSLGGSLSMTSLKIG